MSFFTDLSFYESTWRDDADARELSERKRDEIAMQDYAMESEIDQATRRAPMPWNHDAGPKCCEEPANFSFVPVYSTVDPETGYLPEPYFECTVCGSRIAEEDYAALCTWANQKQEIERKQQQPAAQPRKVA